MRPTMWLMSRFWANSSQTSSSSVFHRHNGNNRRVNFFGTAKTSGHSFCLIRISLKREAIEGGIRIIASLLAGDDTGSLICGLLTHTVTPETQPQQWEDLSKAHGIPRDRFVVIPKLHLSKAPILFAQLLKFAALSPDFTELKKKTKEIIAEAAATAANRVEEVSIYDLDHIVFQVSANEGLWEPDMLFRLHAMFHRSESRRLAHDGGALEAIAANLRKVSGIPTRMRPPSNSCQRMDLAARRDVRVR